MANSQDSPAVREAQAMHMAGTMVAYGSSTTSGSANVAALVTHGAKDFYGNAFVAANLRVIAIPTAGTAVYRSAATTATQIDIRSTGTSITYDWFLFAVT